MVFFTCNHCGESVKKPSVEKHYNTKCRGAPKSISCMDCQKDFQENYVEHVKCITELQKYSGKDYVHRESANSGAKKQEGWVETVRAVLDSSEYNLNNTTRQAFEMLQKYDNVPRKKAKFLNFVTNSVRIPRKTVEEVWGILEKEQEKIKQAKQQQLEAAKTEKQSKEQNGTVNGDEKQHKKKKSKADDDSSESESNDDKTTNGETANGINEKQQKKLDVAETTIEANGLKKKKRKHTETEEVPTTKILNDVNENVSKKKKKKTTDNAENCVEAEQEVSEQKSKKKSKSAKEEDNQEQPYENGVGAETKKKKKRAAENNETSELDISTKKQKLNGETHNENESSKKKKNDANVTNDAGAEEAEAYVFCWDYEFTNVMSKYADGINVEKLKKKILKKYKTKFDAELTERQQLGFEKKFNKKLKKNNLLKVEDDIVKSVS